MITEHGCGIIEGEAALVSLLHHGINNSGDDDKGGDKSLCMTHGLYH